MKTMKRVLCLVLTLVMVAGMLPTISAPAEAAYSSDHGEVDWSIAPLEIQGVRIPVTYNGKTYGEGTYFTRTGAPCSGHNNCYTYSNGLTSGSQCWGFAMMVGDLLEKSAGQKMIRLNEYNYIGADRINEAFLKDMFLNSGKITPGAKITVGNKGGITPHVMIFLRCDSQYIWTYEGNYDGRCGVYVVRSTWSQMARYIKNNKKWLASIWTFPCDHSWNSKGNCGKCGVKFSAEESTSENGTYRITSVPGEPMRHWPDTSASKIKTLLLASKVEVLGSVTRSGTKWYRVRHNNVEGWAKASGMALVAKPQGSITFSNMLQLTSISKGKPVSLQGTIKSTYDLAAVRGTFINVATGKTQMDSTIYKPSKKSVSLYNTPVDNTMYFGKLQPGSYQYRITASDTQGLNKVWTSNTFQVVAPTPQTCGAPEFFVANGVGKKTVTISSSTAGATISYSYGGKSYSHVAPVSFDLTKTATIEAIASKNGMSSSKTTQTVTVNSCVTPTISSGAMTSEGLMIALSVHSGETGWYSINGAAYQKYTGPFFLAGSAIVQAYATRSGYVNSATERQSFTLELPAAPRLQSVGAAHIALGESVSLQWAPVENATSYTVRVLRDGGAFKTIETTSTSTSFAATGEGTYTASVTPKNVVGAGTVSNSVTITAHGPLTVVFQSDDGTALTSQQVRYGYNATAPAEVPVKRGHTFTGWDKSLANITEDTTITAKFSANTYTVRFYDCNGTDLIGTQRLTYGQGIDSPEMEARVTLRTGYSFVGWHIQEAEVDSDLDLEHIDSNMTLVATEHWADSSLPVSITNASAARNADSTGYDVSFNLTCAPSDTIGGNTKKIKVIVVLKSKSNQMLASAIETVNLTEDTQNLSRNVFVSYDGSSLADKAEISVVGIDGNDRTGGALAKTVSTTPTITVVWSEWSTTKPSAGAYETKTQYRYKDSTRSTTQRTTSSSTAPTISGYTYVGSNSAWGSWSGWSDSAFSSSSTREVETRRVQKSAAYTQYRYGRWVNSEPYDHFCRYCAVNSGHRNDYSLDYTAWSTTRLTGSHKVEKGYICTNSNHYNSNHIGWTWYNNGGKNVHLWQYTYKPDLNNRADYYWEESRTISATYKTQYRYRDKTYTHSYEKWTEGAWSGWSDTQYTASSSTNSRRTVESRTMYRYVLSGDQVVDTPSTATTRTISATVPNADGNLAGKLATVLVYKETNSDPTEPQLEYVGQVTLDSGNGFSINIQTKEEPSSATGDYIVAVALQGSSNVVNVGKINAPAEVYEVNFCAQDGSVLETQRITEGQSAQPPAAPNLPGYTFVCWSNDTTHVTRDIEAVAVYVPNRYSVAIVDHESGSIELKTDYNYGDLLLLSDPPAQDGMRFVGWKVTANSTNQSTLIKVTNSVSGESEAAAQAVLAAEAEAALLSSGDFVITDDLIVAASWTPVFYTVNFMYADGRMMNTQSVMYGHSAHPPAYDNIPDDMVFLGWDANKEWWNVTGNMDVYPIMAYKQTATAPMPNGPDSMLGTSSVIEFTTEEGATIYFTTDGSEPNPGMTGTEVYTGPVEVTETTEVKAVAVMPEKNMSETVTVSFWYDDSAQEAEPADVLDIGTYNVVAEPGKTITLQFEIENNPGLAGYMFYVDANPTVFSIPSDPEAGTEGVAAGDICINGTLLTAPYVEGVGWQLLWFSATPTSNNGTLCTVTLETSEEAETGTYPITVRYSPANTFDGDFVAKEIPGVRVDFVGTTEFRMGDVNGDGRITNADVVLIARHIIGLSKIAAEREFLGDVNNDGGLTLADAIYLARYILGLEHSLL